MSLVQNEIVRASAGTGKTFQLSNRYLNLVVRGVDCPTILATTFTRKAAGEILDRIVQRLSAASLEERSATELGGFIGIENLPARRCRNILATSLHQLHRMQIGTLDSFFSRLARSFSLELGLFSDWRVINQNEYEHNLLRDEAIERLLARGPVKELVHLLGKGDAERSVSQLIRSAVRNLYTVYLDSPHDAWQQVPESKLMSEQDVLAIGHRIESTAWPTAKMGEAAMKDFERFVSGDYERFLTVGLVKKVAGGETRYNTKEIPPAAIELFELLIAELARIELNTIAQQTKANFEVLQAYDSVYTQLKSEREVVEYDDISRGLARFVTATSTENLSYRTDRRINHLLLDEFQDTSPIQWDAIRPFGEHVTTDVDAPEENIQAERSFFCVGDTKQAIYGWRGGEAEIFDTVDEQLPNVTDAPPLTDSFRSSPIVINAVNDFFQKMTRHPNLGANESVVANWCDKFTKHSTRKKSLAGYVKMETASDKKKVLEFAAQRVADMYRTIPEKTIGVLVKKNATVGRLIALLGRLGVPASEESGNPLTDSAAVCLILSAMRLADHPGHRIAWFHLQNSPLGAYFGFTDENGELQPYEPEKVAIVSAQLRSQLLEDGYGRTVERLAQVLLPDCKPRERSRLTQMVDLSFNTDFETTLRPAEFASYIETARVSDPTAARVQVMNVHQSKGLEFDIVVLPEVDIKLMPQSPSWVTWREKPGTPIRVVTKYMKRELQQIAPPIIQNVFNDYRQKAINETLCWAYVAVTRARQALHIITEPKKTESDLPKSIAGLLRASVAMETSAGPDTTLFESGDPLWFEERTRGSITAKKNALKSCLGKVYRMPADKPIELAFQTGRRARGLSLTSPSRQKQFDQVRIGDMFQMEDNLPALQRGTLFHRWFQEIQWLENDDDWKRIEPDRLRSIASELPDLQINVENSLKSFRFAIERKPIAAVFQKQFYNELSTAGFDVEQIDQANVTGVEAINERPFAVRNHDEIISGTVDRLVLVRSGKKVVAADVVDFKTDAINIDDQNSLDERAELYRSQMESYRAAVATMYRIPQQNVAAKILFVQPAVLSPVA